MSIRNFIVAGRIDGTGTRQDSLLQVAQATSDYDIDHRRQVGMPHDGELLPCPFCGRPPERQPSGEGGLGLMIECVTEGCVNPHVSYYDHQSAIRAWNRRSDENERLRAVIAMLIDNHDTGSYESEAQAFDAARRALEKDKIKLISINEAALRGITRLRLDKWDPEDHIEITPMKGGGFGPWVYLWSPTNELTGQLNPRQLLITTICDPDDKCWRPYARVDAPTELQRTEKS